MEDVGKFYGHLVYIFYGHLGCFGIFYGDLVYFVAIWSILWSFRMFWYILWYILWPFGMLQQGKYGNPGVKYLHGKKQKIAPQICNGPVRVSFWLIVQYNTFLSLQKSF
jgi:hypothetical protein